jgi:hypothetical protein
MAYDDVGCDKGMLPSLAFPDGPDAPRVSLDGEGAVAAPGRGAYRLAQLSVIFSSLLPSSHRGLELDLDMNGPRGRSY